MLHFGAPTPLIKGTNTPALGQRGVKGCATGVPPRDSIEVLQYPVGMGSNLHIIKSTIYNSDKRETKTVFPRVDHAPHVEVTSTGTPQLFGVRGVKCTILKWCKNVQHLSTVILYIPVVNHGEDMRSTWISVYVFRLVQPNREPRGAPSAPIYAIVCLKNTSQLKSTLQHCLHPCL